MKLGHLDTDERVVIVAEVGINHNGSYEIARRLIKAAADAGADAVKFQVGNPDLYVNAEGRDVPRETPWGIMPYIEYRKRMELPSAVLLECKRYAAGLGLFWFASPLDADAVATLELLDVPCYKIASPMLTDMVLLETVAARGKPVLLSSGMSTSVELARAVDMFREVELAVMHCTSEYPCPPEHTNLRVLTGLKRRYPGATIGYSGHETGVPQSVAAVALGARIVERHLTLSRAMWGSDHAASLEPEGLRTLVRYIRTVERSLGDGEKVVYDGERVNMAKFRKGLHTA